MKDEQKTKSQLLAELQVLRQQLENRKSLPGSDGQKEELRHRLAYESAITECIRMLLVAERTQLLSILDSLDEICYVTDTETYEILYVSKAMKSAFSKELLGGICYKEFQGLSSPCDFCTNKIILNQKPVPHRWIYHNSVLNRDYAIVDRIISWPDGRDVRFEFARDITDQLLAEEVLRKQHETLEKEIAERTVELQQKNSALVQEAKKRKMAEQAIRENTERFQSLSDASFDAIFLSTKGRVLEQNKAAAKMFGYTREEIIGTRATTLISPEQQDRTRKKILANDTRQYQSIALRKDGSTFPCEIQAKMISYKGQEVRVTALRDMSRRQLAEKALKESEQKYRQFFSTIANGWAYHKIILDKNNTPVDYVFLEVNKAFEQMTGLQVTDIIGQRVTKTLPGIEDDPADFIGKYGNVALSGRSNRFDVFAEQLNKWFSITASCPQKGFFITVFEDITDRKMAAKVLADREALLQSIFRAAPIGINLGLDRTFYWTNEKFSEITGYSSEELTGQDARMLYCSDEEFERVGKEINRIIDTNTCGTIGTCWQHQDGTILDISLSVTTTDMPDLPQALTFTALDITQRKEAERALIVHQNLLEQRVAERTEDLKKTQQQLVHSEKLAAIGRLSASIAHEFNNPLHGIQSVLEGVQGASCLGQEDTTMVGLALGECDRVRKLIQNLLDFNAPSLEKKEPFNLHEGLDAILPMCMKDLRSSLIKVEKQYLAELPLVQAVPDQIKQVLLNLITNARDAMQQGGGLLTIETEQKEQQLLVHIRDTGKGIDSNDLPHIFEPFFTTKSTVKGTGLGLSVSYGIIKNHGGRITVKSVPGKGSTLSLTLPIEE